MEQTRFSQAGGVAAIIGGVLWIATIAWYTQQPIADDGLKEGWDAFNRYITLVLILFAGALVGMHTTRNTTTRRPPYSLSAVLGGTAAAFVLRLLVDVGGLPSPFAFLGIIAYTMAFLWFLVETIRAARFPRRPAIALLACTLLMLAFIGTDSAWIWFTAPFAFAWMWVGYVLMTRQAAP